MIKRLVFIILILSHLTLLAQKEKGMVLVKNHRDTIPLNQPDTMFYDKPKLYNIWQIEKHIIFNKYESIYTVKVRNKAELNKIIEKFKADQQTATGKFNYIIITRNQRKERRK